MLEEKMCKSESEKVKKWKKVKKWVGSEKKKVRTKKNGWK